MISLGHRPLKRFRLVQHNIRLENTANASRRRSVDGEKIELHAKVHIFRMCKYEGRKKTTPTKTTPR